MSPGLEEDPNKLTSILSQVKQLKEIITDKDFSQYHKQCDIFISPDLKGVGMLSFDAESVARVTQSGYEAASAREDEFMALKEKIFSGCQTAPKAATHKRAVNIIENSVLISKIELLGVGKDIERWMRRACTVRVGDMVRKADIDESVSIYYGTGSYESITYTLHNDSKTPDGYILRFNFVEKPPHNFGLGFRFDSQDMLSVLLRLGINSNRMSGFKADFEPINTLGTFAYLSYDNLNKHRFPTRGVKSHIDFTWKDGLFSREGIEKLHFGALYFGFESYVPIIENRFVMIPQLYGSFLIGKGAVNGTAEGWNPIFRGPVPKFPYMNNVLGGVEMGRYIDHQLPFIGVNKISFAFNNAAIARVDMRVRVYKSHYLTAMVNYCRSSIDMNNFFKERSELQWSELYDYNASNWWGAGVRYSIDTKVGPLNFDVSSSNISKSVNLYFSFGYYF